MIHSLLYSEWRGCARPGYTDDDPASLGRGTRERPCYGGNLAHHGRIQGEEGEKRRGKRVEKKEGESGKNVTHFSFFTPIFSVFFLFHCLSLYVF